MPDNHLPSLEEMVIAEIDAAFAPARSILLGNQPDEPTDAESRAMLECWRAVVQRQGLILARLSLLPWRRSELKSNMPSIMNRAPAWLDAHYRGEQTMTLELFAHGIAETMTTQRVAFEQVLVDQVSGRAPLQALLAEAPIPPDPNKLSRSELLAALAQAMSAHTEVLVGIAADVDAKLQSISNRL